MKVKYATKIFRVLNIILGKIIYFKHLFKIIDKALNILEITKRIQFLERHKNYLLHSSYKKIYITLIILLLPRT